MRLALTNAGDAPLFAYWCAHPLFRYEADMHVEVGGDVPRPETGKSRNIGFSHTKE